MKIRRRNLLIAAIAVGLCVGTQLASGQERAGRDTVSVRLVDAELRVVIQSIARYLAKPVLYPALPSIRATLETPLPVSASALPALLRVLLATHGFELQEDSVAFVVVPRTQPTGQQPGVAPDGIRLYVHRLNHARASDVAATVNRLFGGGGEFAGRPTLPPSLGQQNTSAAAEPAVAGAGANLRGSVTLVPDELTNALMIRASEADHAVLVQAIEQLDVRPLQVLIEVLIVEARNSREFSLGADVFVPASAFKGGTAEVRSTGGGLGDLVIKLLSVGRLDVDATLRAAESRGVARILSRPVVVASNNTEARLLVGSQRPFVQVSRSLPTDTPSRDQVVQYRDVGTRLVVRPTINSGGYVYLLVSQEINAATSEVQFDAPVISTREARTEVLVRDGQTIMIGGLRDQQLERQHDLTPES